MKMAYRKDVVEPEKFLKEAPSLTGLSAEEFNEAVLSPGGLTIILDTMGGSGYYAFLDDGREIFAEIDDDLVEKAFDGLPGLVRSSLGSRIPRFLKEEVLDGSGLMRKESAYYILPGYSLFNVGNIIQQLTVGMYEHSGSFEDFTRITIKHTDVRP